MIRAVFFDLYGTLLDIATDEASPVTAAGFEQWVRARWGDQALERERSHPLLVDLRAIRPAPVLHAEPDVAPVVAAHLGMLIQRDPLAGEIVELAGAWRKASRRKLSIIPGALEAVVALRRHFKVGLISNAQLLFTRPDLREVGIDEAIFEPMVISSQVGARKPSRHIFQLALQQADVPAHEAIHVGNDPRDDVDGARLAGLHTVLVDDPRNPPQGEHAPEVNLRSVADLPDALLGARAGAWRPAMASEAGVGRVPPPIVVADEDADRPSPRSAG